MKAKISGFDVINDQPGSYSADLASIHLHGMCRSTRFSAELTCPSICSQLHVKKKEIDLSICYKLKSGQLFFSYPVGRIFSKLPYLLDNDFEYLITIIMIKQNFF